MGLFHTVWEIYWYHVLGSEFEKEVFEHFALRLRGKKVSNGERRRGRGIARDFRCAWLCGF